MYYLTKITVVSIFTNHAKLLYIHYPMGQNPGITHHAMSKLLRWAINLSEFRF